MEVKINDLQENLIEAFNNLITILNDSCIDGDILLHSFDIKHEVKDLAKAVRWIAALQDPETNRAMLEEMQLVNFKG